MRMRLPWYSLLKRIGGSVTSWRERMHVRIGVLRQQLPEEALIRCLGSPEFEFLNYLHKLTERMAAWRAFPDKHLPADQLPKEFVDLATSYLDGRVDEARRIQISILPKIRALFVESNPVPVKTVLALKGLIAEPTVRLPLVPLSAPSREVIKREFLL